MRYVTALVSGLLVAIGCVPAKQPVSSYGPPPKVSEPTPSAQEEFALIMRGELTAQEQADLTSIRTTRYDPPESAEPPRLEAGLDELLRQEGAALIHEKVGYDIPIVLNDRVMWWIDYFTTRIPDSFERYLMRSGAYLPYLKQRLRESGLPEDLAYLVMIESGFSTRAVSRVGAVGPWQFMPYTGREYGLRIDRWVDERQEYAAATSAAIAYLSDLHAMFGSWYLAAAAYNGGQGRVGRSVSSDNTTNFWELTNLARETRDYVPKLIAATIIAKEPERYGFYGVPYFDPLEWETVTVPTSTALPVVAEAAGVPTEVITALNPHLRRSRTPPGEENYPIKIPVGRVDTFNENYAALPPAERLGAEEPAEPAADEAPRHVPADHLVRKGETLAIIATAYGVAEAEILSLNGLRSARDLEPGMVLVLPGGGADEDEAEEVAPATPPSPRASAGESTLALASRTHRVRRGDTLAAIARRYDVAVNAIKRLNDLDTNTIRPGQRLRIP